MFLHSLLIVLLQIANKMGLETIVQEAVLNLLPQPQNISYVGSGADAIDLYSEGAKFIY
jgi:hypothetical protein